MIIALRFSLSCCADHFLAGALVIAVTSAFSYMYTGPLAGNPGTYSSVFSCHTWIFQRCNCIRRIERSTDKLASQCAWKLVFSFFLLVFFLFSYQFFFFFLSNICIHIMFRLASAPKVESKNPARCLGENPSRVPGPGSKLVSTFQPQGNIENHRLIYM